MLDKFKYILQRKLNRDLTPWEINYDEFKERMQNGAIVLDVRSVQEYKEGHLEEAINLPYYEIPPIIEKQIPNKETEILTYCQNGARSKKACTMLKKRGYSNIYNLYGGLDSII